MTVFVDTSAWYALADRLDPAHERAVRSLRELESHESDLVTSEWVLVETVTLLHARKSSEMAKSRGRSILQGNVQVVPLDPEMLARAWTRFEQAASRVSLVDCGSFEVMQSLGIKDAFAFDQDFTAAGFSLIQPKQA